MIAILGADGLLGSWLCYKYRREAFGFSHKELDITDESYVYHALKALQPDGVINCAALTNKRNVNPEQRMDVNARAPHTLAKICNDLGIKLVQVSTDCVFSGIHGNYTELDTPDADDNYGWTKAQGEVIETPHVTVRASFVGWPDPKQRGLISWLYNSPQHVIEGYKNVWWNGLTAHALATHLMDLAYDYETGIVHVYGETISKYELLSIVRDVYGWGKAIVPVDVPVKNLTLASVKQTPREHKFSFYDQVDAMSIHKTNYTRWLKEQEYA